MQFHETTGAVYDTLAQMSLMRGDYENAAEYLRHAAEAYGAYGRNTSRWYEWSLRVITARLATRRGRPDEALAIADEIASPTDGAAGRNDRSGADRGRSAAVGVARGRGRASPDAGASRRLDPRTTPGAWGEFLRLRGSLRARQTRTTEAYHDIAQSSSVFELVGERYQAAVSQLALARLAAKAGARSTADRHYQYAAQVFQALGATRDLEQVRAEMAAAQPAGTGEYVGLARRRGRCARAAAGGCGGPAGPARARAGRDDARSGHRRGHGGLAAAPRRRRARDCLRRRRCRRRARHRAARACRAPPTAPGACVAEAIGREPDGPRHVAIAIPRPLGHPLLRRVRMMAAVARQGFDLCGVRDRPTSPVDSTTERPLEPLLPGFLCASAAMHRVVDQIQRLQGNDLTVLITGESGTGKELVARAIHVGSSRNAATFLPVQLHDHHARARRQPVVRPPARVVHRRRVGSARPDSHGRPAARCSSTKSATCRSTSSPSCCASWSRAKSCRSAKPGRSRSTSACWRPPTPTSNSASPKGKFREDLYYRLERDPHSRAAAAPTARGDSAPDDVLPARGVGAARASPTCS